MWPFELGKTYNRGRDIHERYRGQQQGGIITPAAHPLVIAITGAEGEQHGYRDRLRPDGVFEYFGEGQVGPMQMNKGNRAILEHSAAGKSLLLFRKVARSGALRYEGEWICEGYEVRQAPDSSESLRDAFVFHLRPLEAIEAAIEAEAGKSEPTSLAELRARAMSAARPSAVASTGVRTVYQRSRDVRAYVLARAAGKCEGCKSPAPFQTVAGVPYLEPHHIRRVSDGGPDDPCHVIALCPNCHRRAHLAVDYLTFNAGLADRMLVIEPDKRK